MTREDLFLAIGGVDDATLERTELTAADPSVTPNLEGQTMKKTISIKRTARNLLVAAVIVCVLAVTALAATGYLLFDSPEAMLSFLYGDKTGYDHKDVTLIEDPWNPIESPAYDRVPADETLVQEELAPNVSPVGQSLTHGTMTLTIDANLYDSATHCGLLTYTLEDTKGLQELNIQLNGETSFWGVQPLCFNQSGDSYIIQNQTTENKLTAVYYYHCDGHDGSDLELWFRGAETSEEDFLRILEEVRGTMTPEAAQEKTREVLGQEYYEKLLEMAQGEELVNLFYEAVAGYEYEAFYQERMDSLERLTIPLDETQELAHVTLEEGSIVISPIAFTIDVTNLEFLHTNHLGDHWVHADNVDEVVICFKDGTEYMVSGENVENNTLDLVTRPYGCAEQTYTTMVLMFNRAVDVEKIATVRINGTEMKLD